MGEEQETDREFMERENRRHRIAVIMVGILTSERGDCKLYRDVVKDAVFIDDCICEQTG